MTSVSGSGSSDAGLTALQRAQALADAAGNKTFPNEQFAVPFIPSANSDWSYSYDYASGGYSWSSSNKYGDTTNIFDAVGVLTPAITGFSATFEQISTPSGSTPGISTTVATRDQISYRQQVANRSPAPGEVKPANQTPANLGRIGNNSGRLVLLGKLDSNLDDVDTYSFDLQNTGNLRILAPDPNSSDATASLGPVHLQVFDSTGKLLADSDPATGEAYLTYVKLDQSALTGPEFEKGRYTVKLSYKSDAPADAKGDYSLFIVQGSDPGRLNYYTVEKQGSSKQTVKPATVTTTQDPVLNLFA
jgi:hypothetical protein